MSFEAYKEYGVDRVSRIAMWNVTDKDVEPEDDVTDKETNFHIRKFHIAMRKCKQSILIKKIPNQLILCEIKLLIKNAKILANERNLYEATNNLVQVYDICNKYKAYDRRSDYPGCGHEIKLLVEFYITNRLYKLIF